MFSFIEVHIWSTLFTDIYWPTYIASRQNHGVTYHYKLCKCSVKKCGHLVLCPCKVLTDDYVSRYGQSSLKTLRYTGNNASSWLVIYLWKSSSLPLWIQLLVFSKMEKKNIFPNERAMYRCLPVSWPIVT